jgi:type IV pilus assembly protein PilM
VAKFEQITSIGLNLQKNVDGRLLWLELLKAIDAALPRDPRPPEERKETAEDVAQRTELHIESMDCEFFPDLASWYAGIQQFLPQAEPQAEPPADAEATGEAAETGEAEAGTELPAEEVQAAPVEDPAMAAGGIDPATGEPLADAGGGATGESGEGWVIQLRGYHLHNSLPDKKVDLVGDEAEQFIINSFFNNLKSGTVKLPDGPNGQPVDVPIADLGIRHPVVVTREKTKTVQYLAEATDEDPSRVSMGPSMEGRGGVPTSGTAGQEQPKIWKLRRYDFLIQFAWQPQPRRQRLEKMAQEGQAAPGTAAAAGDVALPGDSS